MNSAKPAPLPSRRNSSLRTIALVIWTLIVLAQLFLFVVDQYFDFHEMQVACTGALGSGGPCNFLAISPAEVDALASWGLTTRTYAWVMLLPPIILLLVYWLLGGVILWRQGTTVLGLTVSLALITLPLVMVSGDHDWSKSFPALVFFGVMVSLIGNVIMVAFLYLLPNGRFSPKWAYIPFLCTVVLLFLLVLVANNILVLSAQVSTLVNLAIMGLVILGAIFQVHRYLRDSSSRERQQTKWILLGILALFFSVIVWVLIFGPVLSLPAGKPRLLAYVGGWYLIAFLLLILPVTITIAILRYRLWDIDVVIRKTLVYSVLTALLALVYFGSVILLQSLFDRLAGVQDSTLVVVISTLAIAALFTPLRRRIQDGIDRRFYRKKYNAQQVLARFAQTARDETDLDALLAELVRVVDETLQPEHVSVWLRPQEQRNVMEPPTSTG